MGKDVSIIFVNSLPQPVFGGAPVRLAAVAVGQHNSVRAKKGRHLRRNFGAVNTGPFWQGSPLGWHLCSMPIRNESSSVGATCSEYAAPAELAFFFGGCSSNMPRLRRSENGGSLSRVGFIDTSRKRWTASIDEVRPLCVPKKSLQSCTAHNNDNRLLGVLLSLVVFPQRRPHDQGPNSTGLNEFLCPECAVEFEKGFAQAIPWRSHFIKLDQFVRVNAFLFSNGLQVPGAPLFGFVRGGQGCYQ